MLKRWDFLEKATAENLLPTVSTLDTLNRFTYDPAWFLPSYPPISSNDFMMDIVTKKEFWDTEDAIYLDHQVRIARYLDEHSVYDSLLLFHEPGTGKSSVAIALMDLLKSSSSPFQHGMVLFVANNMTILNNFRDQIRKRSVLCRDRILFLTSEISNPERRAQRQNELWTTVFNFFDIRFYTYHQLAKKMDEEGGQSLLLQQLSYSILIMDESHHLHYQKSGTQGERTYWNLHRLLHSLPKKRLLLLTGTPIQDQPEEIALLWNLMLPMDQQIPTGKEFVRKYLEVTQTIEVANLSTDPDDLQQDLEEAEEEEDIQESDETEGNDDEEEKQEKQSDDTAVSFPTVELVVYQWKEKEKMELAEILKGRNSFLKQSVGDVRIKYRGILVTPMVSLPLETDRMSQFQSFYYLKGIEGDLRNTGKKKEKSYKNSVQSTLFVFPDGSSGERGFSRFVDYSLPKKKGGDDLASAALFRKFTLKLKESAWGKYTDLGRWKSAMTPVGEKIRFISEFSSIYGKFLEEFLAPENLLKKAYAYSFLVKGSGIMLLLLILQEFFGFEIITNASPKMMDTKTPKNRLLFINDAVRTPDGDVQEMLRFFNQPDNKNGKLCRLVLSTNKTTEGISLFHIRQVHILTPAWNLSEISQAIARGIREGSHKGLENPTVDIFLHCAFPVVSSPGKGDDSGSSQGGRLTGVEKNFSIDFQRYVRSEIKDRNMTLVQRFVMTTSWDCVFNAERNQKNRVEDGSKDCDYQECEYSCWPWERPSGVEQAVILDSGNASLWYDEKLYGQMENHLRTFFRRQPYTTGKMLYEYILERVEGMTPFEFLTFVSEWIDQKMVLYSIFGTACLLQYEAPYYFVVGYIPGCTNLPLDNIPLEMYAQRPLVSFSMYATPQQMVETDWGDTPRLLSNLTGIHQEIHRMVMILVSNKPVEFIKKAEKRLSILVKQFPPGLRGDVFETYWMAFYRNRQRYLQTKNDLPKLLALYELLLIFQRVFEDARVEIVFGSHPQKRWEEFYKHPEAVPTSSHSFLPRRRRFEVDSETWEDEAEEEAEGVQVQQTQLEDKNIDRKNKMEKKKTKKKPKVVKEMKKLLPEEEMSRQDLDRYIFENPVGYYMYKKDRLLYFRDVEDKDLYRTKDRKKIPAGRACSNMKMGDILYIMLMVFRFMRYSSTFDEKSLVHLKKYKTEEEMRLWVKKPREELEEMFMRAGSFPKFIQHFPLPEGIESVEDPRFVPGVMGSITNEELEYLIIIMQLVINTELCPLMMEIFKEMSLFREADTTVMRRSRSGVEGEMVPKKETGEKEIVGGGVEESKN